MKSAAILLLLVLMGFHPAGAQSHDVIQLGLNIEKLNQFRQILADMRRAYTVLSRGYNAVRDLSQGNFKLHELFLDGLMAVSPGVARYRRIPEIIAMQRIIVAEYRTALSRFRRKGMFTPDELSAIQRVYAGLFDKSVRNLEELILIMTGGKLRMTDAERMAAIDRVFASVQGDLSSLRQFNLNTGSVARMRGGRFQEIEQLIGRQASK
ncbi:TerB family tellurite resistance protein [Chitinophaga cymbidii]|uniref:TerB family tellurite resistance protein n=1 Tax=Chitinophaga cymbidii TaxID=1096750 RepID=A0A512RS91_9BACT|nr:TerB family tellurite resistance protein [Chitinophaga cymbidii]GEP98566.1 hypothetical protein CCY01nite_48260 [Chitinophaga cymbidii]